MIGGLKKILGELPNRILGWASRNIVEKNANILESTLGSNNGDIHKDQ